MIYGERVTNARVETFVSDCYHEKDDEHLNDRSAKSHQHFLFNLLT